VDWNHLAQDVDQWRSEHSDELLGTIKSAKFLRLLSDCLIVMKDSDAWINRQSVFSTCSCFANCHANQNHIFRV
jgi:hypothetical protein